MCGSFTLACPEGKKCKSGCSDTIKYNLADQGSNKCEHFKLVTLIEQGRKRYKLDMEKLICSYDHVALGPSEVGNKAPPCN